MRLAIAAATMAVPLAAALWPAASAVAAEGDRWSIDRQNVNVRSGPATSTEILMTINAGEPIIEIAAKGDWYFVEFPDRGRQGWIYGPLLIKPDAVSARAPAKDVAKEQPPAPQPRAEAPSPSTETAAPGGATASTNRQSATDGQSADAAAQPSDTASLDVEREIGGEPDAVKSFRETVTALNDSAVSVAGISLFEGVRSVGGGGVQVLATDSWTRVPEAGQASYMNALFDRWRSVANDLGPLSLQIIDPSGKVMMERTDS